MIYDGRPLTSESLFHVELLAIDRNNPGSIINTVTNRIRFKFDEPADPKRIYIGKVHRSATYNPSGLDIDLVTNIVDLINNSGGVQGFVKYLGFMLV